VNRGGNVTWLPLVIAWGKRDGKAGYFWNGRLYQADPSDAEEVARRLLGTDYELVVGLWVTKKRYVAMGRLREAE
jgi:hypothetical protein